MVEIPAPPFSSGEEGRRFQHLLLLYLRELKVAGEPVGFHQFVLVGLANIHEPAPPSDDTDGDVPPNCVSCGVRYPCRTILAIASDVYFPVRWTAVDMARCLLDAGVLDEVSDTVTPDRIVWGRQVRQAATWSASGRWRWEIADDRGAVTREYYTDQQLAALLLIEAGRGRYPYQFSTQALEEDASALRPAAAERLIAWRRYMASPAWQGERRFGTR